MRVPVGRLAPRTQAPGARTAQREPRADRGGLTPGCAGSGGLLRESRGVPPAQEVGALSTYPGSRGSRHACRGSPRAKEGGFAPRVAGTCAPKKGEITPRHVGRKGGSRRVCWGRDDPASAGTGWGRLTPRRVRGKWESSAAHARSGASSAQEGEVAPRPVRWRRGSLRAACAVSRVKCGGSCHVPRKQGLAPRVPGAPACERREARAAGGGDPRA